MSDGVDFTASQVETAKTHLARVYRTRRTLTGAAVRALLVDHDRLEGFIQLLTQERDNWRNLVWEMKENRRGDGA